MSRSASGLILLDRDGVLNQVVVDPEHGTIDSPLHPCQVTVFEWVPEALRVLTEAGYALAVVTNQPSVAKGKTTQANLEAVHLNVLVAAQSAGGIIRSSHICFHRSEDNCSCRKPKTGLLEEALRKYSEYDRRDRHWMVGDGVTDIMAGQSLGMKTAFLGAHKCDACQIFNQSGIKPVFWGKNLLEFARHLINS